MKNIKVTGFNAALFIAATCLLAAACSKVNEFSKDYDINWPVPKITSFTPVKDTIGKTITITGELFDKLTKVTIGNPETEATIVSSTATSIVARIPRTVSAGPVTVYTNYKQKGVSDVVFTPVYLDVTVTNWPAKITRGLPFIIRGNNMDMITQVEVDGTKIDITPTATSDPTQLLIPTAGLTLPDAMVVKVTTAKAGIINGTSSNITVENPSNFFVPELPVLLFDFETGSNPFNIYGGITATSGFNVSGAPKGRAARYFSLQKPNAVAWEGLGEMVYSNAINLASFNKPHFSFLVNTRNKDGYMQVEFNQGGTKWGMHFKAANSAFDYNLKTNGWTWVTVELKTENLEKWGGTGTSFNAKGTIDAVTVGFKRGNGTSGDYEINLDHLMITDGSQKPVFRAFDFENGLNPYSGSATSGINQSGIPSIMGNNYLTVSLGNTGNWNWTGDISRTGPIDLSAVVNPYLNFWVNTNGKKGFFQLETNQASVKWGASINTSDYFLQTNGWQLISVRMAELEWGKWGGSGTATAIDVKGVLDYFKVGFSTGNVAGPYEVNIDDVFISDGKMF